MVVTMALRKPTSSQILGAIQAAVRKPGTNPYQIAKARGMPLTTVQRLLTKATNTPLRNVEMQKDALGLNLRIIPAHAPVARHGTGRRHGRGRANRRA